MACPEIVAVGGADGPPPSGPVCGPVPGPAGAGGPAVWHAVSFLARSKRGRGSDPILAVGVNAIAAWQLGKRRAVPAR